MKEIKCTNTGNKLIVNCAPTRDVLRLKEVILKELIKHPLGIKLKENQGDLKLLEKEVDMVGLLDFIKNTVLSIDTSEEFNEAVFNCLKYCTYKTTYKIDMDLFDNTSVPEAREDYYEIILVCIEENLRPFAKSLISMWKMLVSTGKLDQLLSLM